MEGEKKQSPTQKQLGKIEYLLFKVKGKSAETFIAKLPNDLEFASHFVSKIHPKGDYRSIYLIENLREKATLKQCSYLISLLEHYYYKKFEEVILKIINS